MKRIAHLLVSFVFFLICNQQAAAQTCSASVYVLDAAGMPLPIRTVCVGSNVTFRFIVGVDVAPTVNTTHTVSYLNNGVPESIDVTIKAGDMSGLADVSISAIVETVFVIASISDC